MRSAVARCALTALALVLVASFQQALPYVDGVAAQAVLRVAWDRTYGSDTSFTEFRAIAAAPNDGLLIAVSERNTPEAAQASAVRLVLWRIDTGGKLTSETEVKDPAAAKSTNTAAIRDVTALGSGDAVLLVDFEGGRPSIVKVDGTGKQTMARAVLPQGRAVTLLEMVPAASGSFLLLGHESLDALCVSVDIDGTVLWEKKQDRGKMEFFVDGLSAPDGTSVLVGNSGQYDAVRSGPSIVWVGRYDAKGNPKGELTFGGRYGQIVASRAGGYAVVYDKSDTTDQQIRIKGLTADLKEIWDESLLITPAGFSDFKIAALPGGGFVVGGGKDGRSYIAAIDEKGRQMATLAAAGVEKTIDVGSYGLAQNDKGSLFLASSYIQALTKGSFRRKVHVRKAAM